MEISVCVKYVGVNDHQVDLFEGQYKVPNGMSYNSYVILDDKIAVMDTVDGFFTEEWLNNVEQVLDGKMPDYLIIQHMEPDHLYTILRKSGISLEVMLPFAMIVCLISSKLYITIICNLQQHYKCTSC